MRRPVYLSLATLLLLIGAPAGAQETIVVPDLVMETIGALLPEKSNAGAAFVSEVYSPNLVVTETATVEVVFLWEGAGYRNSLGYFTFSENADGTTTILDADLLIPDASFPVVETGDVVPLLDASGKPRLFEAGERIGFFVIADGWNRSSAVRSWEFAAPGIPATDGDRNAAIGRGCFTTLNRLNPEFAAGRNDVSRHVAMIRMDGIEGFLDGDSFLLTGFEDLNRASGSDNDFNDLVFVVRSTPEDAIANTEVVRFSPGDPDGDGVEGLLDSYPNDPDRAFVQRFPAAGENVLALEDHYPNPGDADFNDAVVAYTFQTITNANGDVVDILATFHLLARGAAYDHRFGLHLASVPTNTVATVTVERYLNGGAATHAIEGPQPFSGVVDAFVSTRAALARSVAEPLTNTLTSLPEADAASARVLLHFSPAVPSATLGAPPYDLFFSVKHGDSEWDIHRPGFPGFADRPTWLPDESGAGSFVDGDGFPFLLDVPMVWQFPLERAGIAAAYPSFTTWRTSNGRTAANWYQLPRSGAAVSSPVFDYIPGRDWSVSLPTP